MKNGILLFLSLSLLFTVLGLVFIVIFVNSIDAACQLESDNSYTCRISKLLFGKYKVSEWVVTNITGVTIKDDGCKNDGCFYRLEFITADGSREPFNNMYTELGPVKSQGEFFRSQLNARVQTFAYHIDPPWWILSLAGGLDLSLMFMLFLRMKRKISEPENSPD